MLLLHKMPKMFEWFHFLVMHSWTMADDINMSAQRSALPFRPLPISCCMSELFPLRTVTEQLNFNIMGLASDKDPVSDKLDHTSSWPESERSSPHWTISTEISQGITFL